MLFVCALFVYVLFVYVLSPCMLCLCGACLCARTDAEACVVAFSTTDRASFEAVEGWIRKVEAEVGKIPMVLIQNKVSRGHRHVAPAVILVAPAACAVALAKYRSGCGLRRGEAPAAQSESQPCPAPITHHHQKLN